MAIPSLSSGNVHDIQEFFLTKISLLLARHAQDSEWWFEVGAIRAHCGEDWEFDSFLLDYTLARHLVAAGPDLEGISWPSPFVRYFAIAVGSAAFSTAFNLWQAEQKRLTEPDAITAQLWPLARQRRLESTTTDADLPAPYSDTSHVDTDHR